MRSGRGPDAPHRAMTDRTLRRRARRIGMTSDPAEDFDDPDVDEGPLRGHVVCRKLREP